MREALSLSEPAGVSAIVDEERAAPQMCSWGRVPASGLSVATSSSGLAASACRHAAGCGSMLHRIPP